MTDRQARGRRASAFSPRSRRRARAAGALARPLSVGAYSAVAAAWPVTQPDLAHGAAESWRSICESRCATRRRRPTLRWCCTPRGYAVQIAIDCERAIGARAIALRAHPSWLDGQHHKATST